MSHGQDHFLFQGQCHDGLPVLESVADTVGSTTSSQDDSKDDQSNNGQDLDGTEPELGLPIDTCSLLIE